MLFVSFLSAISRPRTQANIVPEFTTPHFYPLSKAYIRVVGSKFRAKIAPTEEKLYCEFARISAIILVSFGGDLSGFSRQISQNFGAYTVRLLGELGGNFGSFRPNFWQSQGGFASRNLRFLRCKQRVSYAEIGRSAGWVIGSNLGLLKGGFPSH